MPLVFIISAPSGSGKSTLVNRLMKHDPRVAFATSVTTRAPRNGEIDGEAYRFVSREQFLAMRGAGELLEWAEVFGNFYGTPRAALDIARQNGKDLILDIDVQGAAQLRETLSAAITIFILPPSRQVLEQRLRKRSSDSNETIEQRLGEAAGEVGDYESYDYVLVNKRLEESFEQLHGILLAERARTRYVQEKIGPILESFAPRAAANEETVNEETANKEKE